MRRAHAPVGVIHPDRAADGLITSTLPVNEGNETVILARFLEDESDVHAWVPLSSLEEVER